jgi:hypothetical protein
MATQTDDLTVGYVDEDRTISGTKPYKYCVNGVDGAIFNSSLANYQKAICPVSSFPYFAFRVDMSI